MHLTSADIPVVHIHDRVRAELREQSFPSHVRLVGSPMLVAVATRLLGKHAPDCHIMADGAPVQLLTLEQYGAAVLSHMLEHTAFPSGLLLLYTIPEAVLRAYATSHNMPLDEPSTTDAQELLARITAVQPQAPFTLLRSAQRLSGAFAKEQPQSTSIKRKENDA